MEVKVVDLDHGKAAFAVDNNKQKEDEVSHEEKMNVEKDVATLGGGIPQGTVGFLMDRQYRIRFRDELKSKQHLLTKSDKARKSTISAKKLLNLNDDASILYPTGYHSGKVDAVLNGVWSWKEEEEEEMKETEGGDKKREANKPSCLVVGEPPLVCCQSFSSQEQFPNSCHNCLRPEVSFEDEYHRWIQVLGGGGGGVAAAIRSSSKEEELLKVLRKEDPSVLEKFGFSSGGGDSGVVNRDHFSACFSEQIVGERSSSSSSKPRPLGHPFCCDSCYEAVRSCDVLPFSDIAVSSTAAALSPEKSCQLLLRIEVPTFEKVMEFGDRLRNARSSGAGADGDDVLEDLVGFQLPEPEVISVDDTAPSSREEEEGDSPSSFSYFPLSEKEHASPPELKLATCAVLIRHLADAFDEKLWLVYLMFRHLLRCAVEERLPLRTIVKQFIDEYDPGRMSSPNRQQLNLLKYAHRLFQTIAETRLPFAYPFDDDEDVGSSSNNSSGGDGEEEYEEEEDATLSAFSLQELFQLHCVLDANCHEVVVVSPLWAWWRYKKEELLQHQLKNEDDQEENQQQQQQQPSSTSGTTSTTPTTTPTDTSSAPLLLPGWMNYLEKLQEEIPVRLLHNYGSALFPRGSKFNHSCVPNAEFLPCVAPVRGIVKARQDISPGEEIRISYLDLTSRIKDGAEGVGKHQEEEKEESDRTDNNSRAQRQEEDVLREEEEALRELGNMDRVGVRRAKLRNDYGFECDCPRCEKEWTILQQSE